MTRGIVESGRGERGFTLTELLIASAITLTITGAVFSLVAPAHGAFRVQPEVADVQQRLRIGVETLRRDVTAAGADLPVRAPMDALHRVVATVLPYRLGGGSDDPAAGVFHRGDALSVIAMPPTAAHTRIRTATAPATGVLIVEPEQNCAAHDPLCGFRRVVPVRVAVFDASGAWDVTTVTKADGALLQLEIDGTLSRPYSPGATVVQVDLRSYYLRTDVAGRVHQLMRFDGWKSNMPVIDDVAALQFEYFGEAQPPRMTSPDVLGPGVSSGASSWTTYGPSPPALGVDHPEDTWPAGANCVFRVIEGRHEPRLPVLGDGVGQVALTPEMLQDGPWCNDVSTKRRFDADLLRVRRVRVSLRMQASSPSLRGPAGTFFRYGGTAVAGVRGVPDQEVSFDVTPRALNEQ